MSGVAAVYYPGGQAAEPSFMEKMTTALAHRGMDASGIWCDGVIGLGHRLQHTTVESLREILPLVLSNQKLAITADARLDNRDELMTRLGIDDATLPDSALLLMAYERWGDVCPEKLLGDFAFVIWDGRNRRLFAARDPMGVKPLLYYHQPGRMFICASEIKALLCSPEVPRRLNEVRVAEYLVPLQEDLTNTLYRDIFRLAPGHKLVLNHGALQIQPYWSVDLTREIRMSSNEEYAEAFRDLFTEAVRVRMRSAFPVGSFLSGGLDSSSITCVARNLNAAHGKDPWRTFSAIFLDVPECDEREFIRSVVDKGGVDAHYFHADRVGPLYELDRMFWHEDEAFYAPNLFIHWGIYQLARQAGVRVLLDGFDGDSTVSHGMARLTELTASGRWITLAKEIWGMPSHGLYGSWSGFRRHVVPALIPDPMKHLWRLLRGAPADGFPSSPVMRPEFAARIQWKAHLDQLFKNRVTVPLTARLDHYQRLRWGVLPFVLEVADRAAAALCIEPRYPFFDRRLMEFCLALPSEQKLYIGWSRVVMRRAMEGILPDPIRWRPRKTALGPNFKRCLLVYHKDLLENVILKNPSVIEDYVDIEALRLVYGRFVTSMGYVDALTVWKVLTLALWLRRTGVQP